MYSITPIIVAPSQIGIDHYFGTDTQAENVLVALIDHGHLLKQSVSTGVQRFSFMEFSDRIEQCCDMADPKLALMVADLRDVHEIGLQLTERVNH